MSGKLVVAFFLAAFVAGCLAQSHHWEQGAKQFGDRQLHYEIVQKSASTLQIVTKDISFPAKGQINNATINYIKAFDQYVNGNGGYVTLYAGGVNQKFVTLHFKSQKGHGFNFILEIWGQ